MLAHGSNNRADVVRRSAATATDDVQKAVGGPVTQFGRDLFRGFIILTEFIWQAGIRMCRDANVGDTGQLIHVLAQLLGTEGAVKADGDRPRMTQ